MLKELQDFGLGEKEARTYLATLELAKATVQQIAIKADINRATTYVQLESLKARGLVSQVTIDKKTFFIAERPEKVDQIIAREKAEVLFKEREFSKILPSLKAIFNAGKDRPDVRFYEGEEAVVSYREEILRERHEFFYAIVPIFKDDPEINGEVIDSLLKKIDDYRLIHIAKRRMVEIDLIDKKYKNFRNKYLPISKLDLNIEIAVFGNRIFINNRKGTQIAVVIEHPVIAASFKQMFELFWGLAE